MVEVIELAVKPFSINSMYTTNLRAKTTDARQWTASVFHMLSKSSVQDQLKRLREAFDYTKHEFHIELTAFYPKKTFYNKEGGVSAKTLDITNWEKPLVDLLFDEKYGRLEYPYGVPNIAHNDKYITKMLSQKKPAEDFKLQIKISIVDRTPDPV